MKNPARLKIIFFGTPESAVPVLNALAAHHDIVAVVTQKPKPVGRYQAVSQTPVARAAAKLNIAVIQPASRHELATGLKKHLADIGVVFSFGMILPPEVLNHFPFGMINLHPSLLPRYRGAAPVPAALKHGDALTGVSIIQLDEKLDHGPIIAQAEHPIAPAIKAPELLNELVGLGTKLLLTSLRAYADSSIIAVPQQHEQATFTRELKKTDGEIKWNASAQQIYNLFRGLYPWPGIYTFYNGHRLRLDAITLGPAAPGRPGQVFETDKNMAVACAQGSIIVQEVTPEGKKTMPAKDFLRGQKNIIGTCLPS